MSLRRGTAASAALAAVLAAAGCSTLHAQTTAVLPARPPGFGGGAFFIAPHISGELGRLSAAGELELGWGESTAQQGSASLSSELLRGLRVTGSATASAAAADHARRADQSVFLMLGHERARIGIGSRRSRASFQEYTSELSGIDFTVGIVLGTPLNLELGVARQSSNVVERGDLEVVRRITVAGYEFTSVHNLEFMIAGWHRDFEVELAATLARIRIAGVVGRGFSDGAPEDRNWLYGRVSAPLTRQLELLAEGGRNGGVPAVGRVPQNFARVGVRMNLNAPPDAPSLPAVAVAEGAVVAHIDVSAGEPRLIIVAPGAEAVEVKGDFTAWESVRMGRGDDGRWSAPIRVGVSHFNVRVDGGEWGVPAGVPVIPDEFSGAPVAVVLVRIQ